MLRDFNKMIRKGIILAGGTGSRLWPITLGTSKQLLPVYDKPLIFYPLSVLMLAGIRDIALITTNEEKHQFERLLGNGKQWGLNFTFLSQDSPDGLAQAYIIAEEFLDGMPSTLILGDNIFYGKGLTEQLIEASENTNKATVFGYRVSDPSRYGVIGYRPDGSVRSIIEKPEKPASNFAVTGLYFLDNTAPERAKTISPSKRGELEIASLLTSYLEENTLYVQQMGRGHCWLDTGTHDSLLDAGNFVKTLQSRQGLQVGSPDEIAYKQGWINREEFQFNASRFAKSEYGKALQAVLDEIEN